MKPSSNVAGNVAGINPDHWRQALLALVLRLALALGVMVYVPSLYFSVKFRMWGVAAVDTVAIGGVICLWYFDAIPFRLRAGFFSAVMFVLGGALLVGVGSISQIYLFGFSLLTTLFLGLRAGLVTVALNGVTLLGVGYLGYFGSDMVIARWPGNYTGWVVITINFLLINTLLTLAIGAVLATLERALTRAIAARATLESEQRELLAVNDTLAQEVKERIRTDESLREKEGLLRIAGQAARLGGWTVSIPDRRISWSDETCDLHEVPRGTVPTMDEALAFYDPKSRAEITEAVTACIANGTPFDLTNDLTTAKGTRLYVRSIGAAVRDATGAIISMQGALQDVTARRRAEQQHEKLEAQLRQALKMDAVGRLAGGVAHDFNNMLGVILGNAQLLLDSLDPSDPRCDDLGDLIHAAERSADLTTQLLAFARQQTISPKVLDLNATIERMLKILVRLIGEDIELIWLPAAKLSPVRMDATQIDQILANLTVNARDAITGVGKLIIETTDVVLDQTYCDGHPGSLPGPYVMLAVSDNGAGMGPETVARLFEPFFTTKEVGKGSGLGLATVYGVVKQNGGFISVYSELGQGTTFKIYLPPCDSGERVEVSPAMSGIPTGTETVLLVEDEEVLLKLARRILEGLGYTVLWASDPRAAVDLASEDRHIDLLITDVIMPHMSGREVWQKVSARRPDMKCLYLSGYTADVIADRGVLDEGVHFLQKPFTTESLANKVRQSLKP